jgi:hypothetical protein
MVKGEFKKTIGTRAEVYHGTARRTSGGLTKNELMINKHGRIVSRKKHTTAKREMRLLKYGFATKKGKFGFVKTKTSKRHSSNSSKRSKSRKMRGGMYANVDDDYTLRTNDNMSGNVSDNTSNSKLSFSDI